MISIWLFNDKSHKEKNLKTLVCSDDGKCKIGEHEMSEKKKALILAHNRYTNILQEFIDDAQKKEK